MTTTSKVLLLSTSVFLLWSGCTNDEPAGGHTAGLELCPPDIAEGWPCDLSDDLACLRGEGSADETVDGTVCRCDSVTGTDGGDLGLVVCDSEPPPGGGYCPEHVHTGDVCDPSASDECSHSCDPGVVCRCVPTADTPDCGHIWLCEGGGGGEPPPGTEPFCDDAALHSCLESGFAECISEDGRYCICEMGPAGEIALRCDGDDSGTGGSDPGDPGGTVGSDPTDPDLEPCTDEHVRSCGVGGDVLCRRDDGCECHCDFTPDGLGGLICDD